MFQIDRSQNRLNPLKACRFSELGFREREHLQEWLANLPSALGEELLIVQKEFDGFDDTRERLDLLALDKDGRLVVIENKLDDTGRDVTWQAMKYAAYVSTMEKGQIVEIYQRYLDRWCGGGNAVERICTFLDVDTIEEAVLNSGETQRILMIAAQFRKEVTATALWLRSHGINVQCFKVTPYAFREELFLHVQQIIPMPEAEEFMISIARKEREEKATEGAKKAGEVLRYAFWQQALEAMRSADVTLYQNINPSKDPWIGAGSGLSGCAYNLFLGKSEVRVELYISRPTAEENTAIFEHLLSEKEAIEQEFRAALDWQPLEGRKACRIAFTHPWDGYNQDNWPQITSWMIDHSQRLASALKVPLQRAGRALRAQGRAA